MALRAPLIKLSVESNSAIALVLPATLCDWLKNLALLPRPIRSKTKTNRDLLARVFPRLARATCICFELSLVYWIFYDFCDWSE